MKILHTVESYLPLKHGMSEVVSRLSEWLVKQGHEVTVATSYCKERELDTINGVQVKSFRVSGNLVSGIKGDKEDYIHFLENGNFDIITNFAAQQWATDLCLEILPRLKGKKVFVPTGFSALFQPSFAGYFEKMKSWMKEYDMNVFLSENYRDINFAKESGITKYTVIPNGASYQEFTSQPDFDLRKYIGVAKDTLVILHVGSYTSMKGHDYALGIFLRAKISNAALVFVGTNFQSEEALWFTTRLNWFGGLLKRSFYKPRAIFQFLRYLKGRLLRKGNTVHLISLKREQLVAAYQQADIFLFPSLIECSPVVLFEAMASRTPFLVTDVGNSAEIIRWGNSGELLPTHIDENLVSRALVDQSATALRRMAEDKATRDQLAENGFNAWLTSFTWEIIAEKYQSLYIQLTNK